MTELTPWLYPWLIIALAILGTFIWRLIGILIGDRIPQDSPWSQWITAAGYAMVSGVMMIIIVFPSGTVAETNLIARIAALAAMTLVMLLRRNMLLATTAAVTIFLATNQIDL